MLKEIDVSRLEQTLNRTSDAIEKSGGQIYELTRTLFAEQEQAIKRFEQLREELAYTRLELEALESSFMPAKSRLMLVKANINSYSNAGIQQAYDEVFKLQLDLVTRREKELNLINQIKELSLRLEQISHTIESIEIFTIDIDAVFNYTTNDIFKIREAIESVQKRQVFGLKIIQAQEEERKRVARDIHDGPAQSMANVVLRTEISERLLNNNQVDLAIKELKELKYMVRDSLADVRQIIFNLRPMVLDDLGLFPTLRKYFQEIAKREEINIELRFTGKEKRFTSSMEVAIFRLIQEIITNIVKHAKASYVEACVEYADQYIRVTIQDDGVGFDEEEILKSNNHFGLVGMKERIELLEGEFNIDSIKNNGTRIMFKIPISEGEEV